MSDGEPFSVEVCGGTHVGATGQVGLLFVVGESSIGGGMRRVEAVTGRAAEELFMERSALLESLADKLETPLVDLEARLDGYVRDANLLRKRLETLEREKLRREAQELLPRAQEVDGTRVLAARTSATGVEAMREMGDWLKDKLSSAVIVLGAVHDNRPTIIAMVTPDLVGRGLHAGDIARETARVMGRRRRGPARDGPGRWKEGGQAGRGPPGRRRAGAQGRREVRLLCLDVGERRIGLAVSDLGGAMATPAGFIQRTRLSHDIARVLEAASEKQAEGIVVGVPLSLNGTVGPQAKRVRSFIRALRRETDLFLDTVDERFSTAEAERLMRQAGRSPSRHKGDVDAAAAAVMLQEYLDRKAVKPAH